MFGFYITNLFVGVMFEAFLSYKNMDSKGGLISQVERRWRDYEKRLCQVCVCRTAQFVRLGENPSASHTITLPPSPLIMSLSCTFNFVSMRKQMSTRCGPILLVTVHSPSL